jgi:hypothetical protein
MPLPSNATLDLDQAPRTSVFRRIVAFIRDDATIKRVVRPSSIRAWDGLTQDSAEFSAAIAPAIRLTPATGPDVFWSPGAMRGDLYINVEMLVRGTCVDDPLNLWFALTRAVYPAAQSDTNANVRALQQAGSYDGLVTFTQPAFDPEPKDNFFYATGQIRVSVNNQYLAG